MIASFTGTRKGMTSKQRHALWIILHEVKERGPLSIRTHAFIHGGAAGADSEADIMAFEQGFERIVWPCSKRFEETLQAKYRGEHAVTWEVV